MKPTGKKKSDPTKPQFVIRLDERGYYGPKPWTPVPVEDAYRYDKRKARAVLNRVQSHNMNYPSATMEPAP